MAEIQSTIAATEPLWVSDVLHFWFTELTAAQWFAKNDAIDVQIRARFLALHERLVAQQGLDAPSPRWALAMVVVLDQFSRNMFRGNPRAYAADQVARRLARSAVRQGFDTTMRGDERMFLYLPFEHSENAADQRISVELIGKLGNASWTHYAIAHQVIIDRFGRFPHRNAVLDRPSSAEEIEFLKDPARAF